MRHVTFPYGEFVLFIWPIQSNWKQQPLSVQHHWLTPPLWPRAAPGVNPLSNILWWMENSITRTRTRTKPQQQVLQDFHSFLILFVLVFILFIYPTWSKSLWVFSACLFNTLQIMFKLTIWNSRDFITLRYHLRQNEKISTVPKMRKILPWWVEVCDIYLC